MNTDQDLAVRLRREASLDRPVAPASLAAAVLRALAETAPATPRRAQPLRFPVRIGMGLAASLALLCAVSGVVVKQRYEERLREMEALAADVSNVAAFLARTVKPLAHGIRV